jgi:hypothetical protein
VRDCLLTVYGDRSSTLAERRVVIPPLPERALLERLWREHIEGSACRYAVAREDRTIRAFYLAEDLLPEAAVRLTGKKGRLGRWATSAVHLGEGYATRAFVGPDLFFRQLDLGPPESWLAASLLGFGQDVEVRAHAFGGEAVYEWEIRSDLYYYRGRAGRWTLYGAGNTPIDRIDAMIAHHPPDSVDDFLWMIGAIKLIGNKK